MAINVRTEQLAIVETMVSKDEEFQVAPLTADQLEMVGGGDMQVIIG